MRGASTANRCLAGWRVCGSQERSGPVASRAWSATTTAITSYIGREDGAVSQISTLYGDGNFGVRITVFGHVSDMDDWLAEGKHFRAELS